MTRESAVTAVSIPLDDRGTDLDGDLAIPIGATGLVVFVHGSGSSRFSPRNRAVAASLRDRGIGTLLFDLLTEQEEMRDNRTAELRFDIELLRKRLVQVTDWLAHHERAAGLQLGYFGASTGAAAALLAAADRPGRVRAVVSRGGRPDLAADALADVMAPTLLIVGGADDMVIELNQQAYAQLRCEKQLALVPGATHLFEEPGTLEKVSELAGEWFARHFSPAAER